MLEQMLDFPIKRDSPGTDIHGAKRINLIGYDNPLTCPLVPQPETCCKILVLFHATNDTKVHKC